MHTNTKLKENNMKPPKILMHTSKLVRFKF